MTIRIKETGEHAELKIQDAATGQDMTADIIGNAGGFEYGDFTQFENSEGDIYYIADEYTYKWWKRYLDSLELAEEIFYQFRKELTLEELDGYENLCIAFQEWYEGKAYDWATRKDIFDWIRDALSDMGWIIEVFNDNSIMFERKGGKDE